MTLKQLVNRHNIRVESVMVDSNPNNPDWQDADHWKVTLRFGRRRLTTPFSMGRAHAREPQAIDVLECLLLDAGSADQPFEDWASDLGFDIDSRKAERAYRIVQRQTKRLQQLLNGAYETFLHAEQE